jgi:hypothetical protein
MSQAEDPRRLQRVAQTNEVTVQDINQLVGASTPHFALQIANRIARLISNLPADYPARVHGEHEIARLKRLGLRGQVDGEGFVQGESPMPSLQHF